MKKILPFFVISAIMLGCDVFVPVVAYSELAPGFAPTYSPKPDYPPIAKQEGMEGQVIIEALVDSDGNVDDVKVEQSSGYKELDNAASSAAKEWKFTKPTKDGEAVRTRVTIPFNFSLTEG